MEASELPSLEDLDPQPDCDAPTTLDCAEATYTLNCDEPANRTVEPCLKLGAARWSTCVAVILGLTATDEDQAYRAMNLLLGVDAHPEV